MNPPLILPAERSGRAASAELQEKRARLQQLEPLQIAETDCEVRFTHRAGVSCLEAGPTDGPAVLYAHGGGFRMGEARLWRGLATRLSAATGRRVVVPDYRLAPEHPYPAGLKDLAAVFGDLVSEHPAVLVGGDSAGGGLSLALAVMTARSGGQAADGVILISPWLDLRLGSTTFETNAATGVHFPRSAADDAVEAYLQGWSPADPLVSPVMVSGAVTSPVLVFASAAETLLGDTLTLVEVRSRAGVATEAVIAPALPHVWPMLMPGHAETLALLSRVGTFSRALRDQV